MYMAKPKDKKPPRAAIVQKESFIVMLPDLPEFIHGEVNRDYWMYADPDCIITQQYYQEVGDMFKESIAADDYISREGQNDED
jgi:hypothetical protein